MSKLSVSRVVSAVLRLGAALALLGVGVGGGWAQELDPCPVSASLQTTAPKDGATISGTVRVEMFQAPAPTGYRWEDARLVVTIAGHPLTLPVDDTNSVVFQEFNQPTGCNVSGTFWYDWNTTALPNGDYWVYSTDRLLHGTDCNTDGEFCYEGYTTYITVHVSNPSTTQSYPSTGLTCPCRRDCVDLHSSTSPLTGHESWAVPITSWHANGATFQFGLEYTTHTLIMPQEVDTPSAPPNYNGLSERNSHWTQPYAQWIELARDENSNLYAVWHRGGTPIAFTWNASTSTFVAPDSDYSLTYASGPISVNVNCGNPPAQMPASSAYASFTITDRAGTAYYFTLVDWQIPSGSECTAIPR